MMSVKCKMNVNSFNSAMRLHIIKELSESKDRKWVNYRKRVLFEASPHLAADFKYFRLMVVRTELQRRFFEDFWGGPLILDP